jgi:hypothetical protein
MCPSSPGTVVGCVVDQHADRAELLRRSGDRRLQSGDVLDVTFGEERFSALVSLRLLERFSRSTSMSMNPTRAPD